MESEGAEDWCWECDGSEEGGGYGVWGWEESEGEGWEGWD